MRLRFLSARDVRQGLPMRDAIEAMKVAFRQLSAGEAVAPPRIHMRAEQPAGDALIMPSYAPALGRMGVKVITLFGDNPARGLPMLQAVVLVFDAATGSPLALMDGTTLTAIRTGAASGAATDLMARPEVCIAAIFGAGYQAEMQLEAVCAARPIQQAAVYDADPARAAAYARKMAAALGVPVRPAASPREALAGADVVCTATTSAAPVFDDADLAPGVHINAIGSYKPHVREIPGETVCRARVVVDRVSDALEEAGDLLMPMRQGAFGPEHIAAELGEVAAGLKPGRESAEQVTFFKSVGVAVQDLAAACRLLENAERLGLGTMVGDEG